MTQEANSPNPRDAVVEFEPDRGAHTARLTMGGHSLLADWDQAAEHRWGAFAMAPWTGALSQATFEFQGQVHRVDPGVRIGAHHGLVRDQTWSVDKSGMLATQLGPPWNLGGSVALASEVSADTVRLLLSVTATTQVMPASLGWHPWFKRRLPGSSDVSVRPPEETWTLAPIKQEQTTTLSRTRGVPEDACVVTPGPIVLAWEPLGHLSIASSSEYFTIFTKHERGLCVEPVTSPPGRMDHLLAPGETLDLGITLTWHPA